MTTNLGKFIEIVTKRSIENTSSIMILHNHENYGTCISLLRQELDSLIRVCYLNTLSDNLEITRLINNTINGIEWEKNGKRIFERKMVNIASHFNSWATDVYDFGNSFTHLTNFHDYKNNDPLRNIDVAKKATIKQYLKSYHQFPESLEITFENIIPYIPKVAEKVSNNLNVYIGNLENRFND